MHHLSRISLIALLACHAAACVSAADTAPDSGSQRRLTAADGTGPAAIKVRGNKLVSAEDGRTIQLLGVSVSGLEQGNTSFANNQENYGNPADPGFAAMASWNMNVVRIPLNEDTWLGVHDCVKDGGSAAQLRANVQHAVQLANAAGLYVILDLHWTAPDAFGCPHGQGSMPDADNSVAFWKSVAEVFKDNQTVLFELFNEPFGLNEYTSWVAQIAAAAPRGQSATDLSILLNGGVYDAGYMYQCNDGCNLQGGKSYIAPNTGPFHTAGMQTLVNTIRATGSSNIILSNAIGWAGQIQTWNQSRPTDAAGQLAAGWHEDGGANVTVSDGQGVLGSGFPIIISEAYSIGDATFSWTMDNAVGFLYWSWVDWGGGGLLSNARTHAANANGLRLKASYCSRPKVNRLAQCGS